MHCPRAFKSMNTVNNLLADLQSKKCPSSYMYDDQVKLCWLHQKGLKLNWFDARKNCADLGAHLMILNTTTAIKIIQNYQIAGKSVCLSV